MEKQTIAPYQLHHQEKLIVDGKTWVLADLGYEDDEGFMKAWWSIGELNNDGMFEVHEDVRGHGSFTCAREARHLALAQISTYKLELYGEDNHAA